MTRRPLLLVAASGLAREALAAIAASDSYDVLGVLDDAPARWGEPIGQTTVLGGLALLERHPHAQVLLCTGKGSTRSALAQRLGLAEERYATVVHPSVAVPQSCSVGKGSIILAGCVLTSSVRMGSHVVAMPNVVMTHDDEIGDFATLCATVTLGGSVQVGPRAYIGMSASVRENLAIGADCVIGMGSVVLRDVPAGQTWFGTPARHHPGLGSGLDSEALTERHTA